MKLEMSTLTSKIMGTGLLFLFVFLSGVWLSNSGKPLNVVILTIHKLIGLATAIVIAVTIYQVNQEAKLSAVALAASVITGLLFLSTIISGGLLSTGKPMTDAIFAVHKVGPFLTVLSTVVTMYLLVNYQQ
jgi:hypothetical protein